LAAPAAPADPQGQSFSVASGGALATTGVHPADILSVGHAGFIPCANLGLLCFDPTTGMTDTLNALSFGWDFVLTDLPPVQFSVGVGSQGSTNTAVRLEANCSPAEPQADVFASALDSANTQDYDGNGVACSSNGGFGLDLTESSPADNLVNLDRNPCLFVDLDCDGLPEQSIFFSLAAGSPTLSLIGATSADILITARGEVPSIFAVGVSQLGLRAGDAIDALCVRDNGNDTYDSEDQVLFSLAPSSPTLTALSASAADLFSPNPLAVFYPARALGLQTTDDVDALMCSFALARANVYLPLVIR
jgi:hypothetical protein